MPKITAKILDSRCKVCGYNTVAWWKNALATKQLCVECDKEQKRRKKALMPPSRRERERRADLALFEMLGSKRITYEFITAITTENSKAVRNRAAKAAAWHILKAAKPFTYIPDGDVVEKLLAKKKDIKSRISKIPMRLNLKQNGVLMRPYNINKPKKVKDFYAQI